MASGATPITIVGNLTSDPELRYTQNGLAVASFSVAVTPRTFDRNTNEWQDGDATFFRCSVWREFAENLAGSLFKGARVFVQGTIEQKSYTTKEGETRTNMEITVDEAGPSLKYATAQVQKVQRNANQANRQQQRQQQQGGGQRQQQQRGGQQQRPPQQQQQQQGDPWGQDQGSMAGNDGWATPGAYDDETPF